jgi:uncharacterized membrane protein
MRNTIFRHPALTALKNNQKISICLLRLANYLLLAVSWIEALYAYPRLPPNMPFWLNFFGQEVFKSKKSLCFFIYPLTQTLFILAFLFLMKARQFKKFQSENNVMPAHAGIKDRLFDLKKEYVLLSLIFINLIFIHLQTSLILLSHQISHGFNELYFFSLFAVVLILIPYYRAKRKFLLKK